MSAGLDAAAITLIALDDTVICAIHKQHRVCCLRATYYMEVSSISTLQDTSLFACAVVTEHLTPSVTSVVCCVSCAHLYDRMTAQSARSNAVLQREVAVALVDHIQTHLALIAPHTLEHS